jgi:hypothetical protein
VASAVFLIVKPHFSKMWQYQRRTSNAGIMCERHFLLFSIILVITMIQIQKIILLKFDE